MIVNGEQISEFQIQACIARMRRESFTAANIAGAALNVGVRNIDRTADRLIQKQRKLRNIEYIFGRWSWIGDTTP